MKNSNVIGIAVSALSIFIIGGSIYYYNDSVSKSNEKLQQTTVTTTLTTTTEKKLVLNKENVKISNEVKDEKTVVITIENIADRTLTDVVVEVNYKDGKIAEVLIPTLNKGDKKKLELPLDNKLNSASIKDNPALTGDFRMMEKAEFSVMDSKVEVIVSTLKAQEKSFYIDKIKSSSLEQSIKDELIKKVEASNDIYEIEKLLKENKIIEEITLSNEHVVFKDGESTYKVESINNTATTITTTTSTTSATSRSSQRTEQVVTTIYTAPAVNTPVANNVNVAPRPITPRQANSSGNSVANNTNTQPQVNATTVSANVTESPAPSGVVNSQTPQELPKSGDQ